MQLKINLEAVIEDLRKTGVLKAQAKEGRVTSEGRVATYNHNGTRGVMIKVLCETDFTAKSDVFVELCDQLCLHIAAYEPKFVSADQVDQDYIAKECEIAKIKLEEEGKKPEMIVKILEGKTAKLASEVSLLSQPFIMNTDITVLERILQTSQATGEKITVDSFVVYKLKN